MDNRFGVRITKGPMNWQVLQQEDGTADMQLEGSWYHPEEQEGKVRVYVRLFNEKDNVPVVNSQEAVITGDAQWTCTLKDIPAGGPYRLETLMQTGDDYTPLEWSTHGDMRHHVCVGDVFVIYGQSNAVGYGRDPIDDTPEIGIHMLRDNGLWDLATHPLMDTTDTIFPARQDGTNTGHSPYLSFARTMRRKHHWPIGLIMAAKGGAPLSRFDIQNGGGDLYYNMLDMVNYQGGKIRAIIWCQGASDANATDSPTYGERLGRTIEQCRAGLQAPDLPWFIVQVSGYGDAGAEADPFWGTIRNAQRLLAHTHKNVYTISTIDSITSDAVHNNAYCNVMIGERIAHTVLHHLYGQKHFLCPEIRSAKMGEDDKTVLLTFDHVVETVFHCHEIDMPFGIFNPDGSLNPIQYCFSSGDTVKLITADPIEKGSTAAGSWQTRPSFKPPYDPGSRLPILSFYNVEIEGVK